MPILKKGKNPSGTLTCTTIKLFAIENKDEQGFWQSLGNWSHAYYKTGKREGDWI